MKQRAISYPVIVMAALLAACATPREILKLKPQSSDTSWFYGQEFTGDSLYGIIAHAAFDEVSYPYYIFDVEIINRSNLPILIDPATFFCLPLDGKSQVMNGDTIYARDPELEILDIDRKLSVNEARSKNQLGLALLAAGVDIATGVAVLSDDNPHNDWLRTDLLDATIIDGEANHFETQNLMQLRDSWKSTTLRKTTLNTGDILQGKVLVPVYKNASYIQLNIPVDNELIRINFMQIRFLP